MILLYNSTETDFTHNGLGLLQDTIIAEVEEQLNGVYSLYLEYPIFGKKAQMITVESIIKASTPKGYQLFRVTRAVKNIGRINIYANHIFFDLVNNFIEDTNIVGKNGLAALDQLLTRTQYAHSFRAFSDISTVSGSRIVRKNPIEAMLSNDDNSFLNRWGGELERDNFNVRILSAIGLDRGVSIRYGKNLVGIEEDLKMDDVATRIMPLGYDGLMLPEKYIDSPFIGNYTKPKIVKMEFSNVKVDENTTEEQAYQILRDIVNRLYTVNKVDIPKVNYRVDFVELSKTEEYKNYAILERVYLGDTVTVKHEKIGIDIKAKIISYKWNCLLNKYLEVQLGNFKDNLGSSISSLNKSIKAINDSLDGLETSVLQQAKDDATELITTGLGGYVVKNRDEILIMDTDNVNTAQKVWRWNKNGLGFSGTGYNGTYGLAMTSDGKIVADFITVGELNGELIKAGSVKATSIDVEYTNSVDNKITGAKNEVTTQFQLADGTISARVGTVETNLVNVESNLNSNIIGVRTELRSEFQITTNSISARVGTVETDLTGKVGKSTILSEINLSQEGIKIAASKVDISGLVTITAIGTPGATTINGSNITTGKVLAQFIDAENLVVKKALTLDSGAVIDYNTQVNNKPYIPPPADLSNYVTNGVLSNTLINYATNSHLTTKLGEDYVITGKILANQIVGGAISGNEFFVNANLALKAPGGNWGVGAAEIRLYTNDTNYVKIKYGSMQWPSYIYMDTGLHVYGNIYAMHATYTGSISCASLTVNGTSITGTSVAKFG